MAQHKAGYTGGINKDIAKDKYDNKHYFDAQNIRVVTNEGLSTGSIENEKGNALLFNFPTVGARYKVTIAGANIVIGGFTIALSAGATNEATYNTIIANVDVAGLITANQVYIFFNDTGVYVQVKDTAFTVTGSVTTDTAAISTVYICGWCRLNEWIVVFTSNTETVEPTSAICQIWKFKFATDSRTVIDGSTSGILDATTALIYNDTLNYSTATYIRDTVSNFETLDKGRVYFTDYFNQVRVVNILDTDLMSVKPTDIDLISEVTLSKPLIQAINNNGSLPVGAHYQYFYKLLDTDGRETIFSPGSQLIDLQENLSSDLSQSNYDIESTEAGTIENKSITIEINDIDTDYDVIELYVAIHTSLDSPSIYKVEDTILTGSSMQFIHSTLDNNINIPYTSFMDIGVPFTAKTIEDRNKVLTAGNIKETTFDVDFDARMYRFNTDGTPNFDLLDADGTSTNYTAATLSTIGDEDDCINPSNDDTNTTYNMENATNRQIYKSDGSTIGGTGINGSFQFTVNQRTGSNGSKALNAVTATDEGYNTVTDRKGSSDTVTLIEDNLSGTNLLYEVGDEINNTKSAKLNALFTGYSRGEVYRFGVVFYSKQGQRSFVHWIADIKMPDPTIHDDYKISDAAHIHFNSPTSGNADTYTYDIGVRFTLDTSSITDDISGVEFVRVKREESDKTRLGTGVVTNFVNYGTGSSHLVTNNPATIVKKYCIDQGFAPGGTAQESISTTLDILGTVYGDGSVTSPINAFNNTNLMLSDHPDILGDLNVYSSVPNTGKYLLNFTAPVSEFRSYTGFSPNTVTDYIRDYGYYTVVEQIYNDDVKNQGSTANIKEHNLGMLYRAKKFYSLSDASQTAQNYRVSTERYLSDGEIIYNTGSGGANVDDSTLVGTAFEYDDSTGIELVANTSYTFYNVTGNRQIPFGLGTAKQFLRLGTTTSGHITSANSLNYVTLTNTEAGEIDNGGGSEDGTIATDYLIYRGVKRYFKEVGYCREVTNQYGGNTFVARSKNRYIATGSYQIITSDVTTPYHTFVFGGDTYTLSYDREYMRQYWSNPEGIFKEPEASKTSIGFVFCAESPVNTSFRTGEHFGGESSDVNNYFRGSVASDGSLSKGDLSNTENFTFNIRHTQSNNVRTDLIAKDFLVNVINKFPNRIKVSKTKVDGELTDSWRRFPVNQYDDVDGSLGEIHKLKSFKDQLLFFQDRGIGILPINERAVIQDITGAELVLGNGSLIGKYKYVTETSGTKHQHSVVASDNSVYYFDSLQNKIYPIQGGSISEALGLSSYLHHNIRELLRDSDELHVDSPVGVHGVYDKKNERIIFSFLGGNKIITVADRFYAVDDIVLNGTSYFKCLKQGDYLIADVINSVNFEYLPNYEHGITIDFNEKLKAFQSFYDYKPNRFLSFDDKLLSINPINRNTGYVHEEGNFGNFYGNSYPSEITLLVMPNPNVISIFNNLEYYSEISIDKEDITAETLSSVLAYSDYQNTGKITMTVGTLAKKRFRTWRHKLKRDSLTTTNLNSLANPRMRNYYILLKLRFDNNNNKRLVLSDVVISYTPTRM